MPSTSSQELLFIAACIHTHTHTHTRTHTHTHTHIHVHTHTHTHIHVHTHTHTRTHSIKDRDNSDLAPTMNAVGVHSKLVDSFEELLIECCDLSFLW